MGLAPKQQRSRRSTRFRLPSRMTIAVGAGAAAIALVAAGCGGSSGNGNANSASGTKVKGGTAVYALPPNTTPNYIFPFTSSSYISVARVTVKSPA